MSEHPLLTYCKTLGKNSLYSTSDYQLLLVENTGKGSRITVVPPEGTGAGFDTISFDYDTGEITYLLKRVGTSYVTKEHHEQLEHKTVVKPPLDASNLNHTTLLEILDGTLELLKSARPAGDKAKNMAWPLGVVVNTDFKVVGS